MSSRVNIALFGESEKANYCSVHYCDNLPELEDKLGHPPEESSGIHFAIQALLYRHALFYFCVEEEGFSIQDYFQGIEWLKKKRVLSEIDALCIPGVGDHKIIDAMTQICLRHSSLLITREQDLQDYLTAGRA